MVEQMAAANCPKRPLTFFLQLLAYAFCFAGDADLEKSPSSGLWSNCTPIITGAVRFTSLEKKVLTLVGQRPAANFPKRPLTFFSQLRARASSFAGDADLGNSHSSGLISSCTPIITGAGRFASMEKKDLTLLTAAAAGVPFLFCKPTPYAAGVECLVFLLLVNKAFSGVAGASFSSTFSSTWKKV